MAFKVHPLFIVFACILVYFGYAGTFFIYFLCIILHEAAHITVARRLGYRLQTVTLLPQGAAIFTQSAFLRRTDEVKIALAGPLVSVLLVLFTLSLWWLAPETYAVTEKFAYANASIAVFNLMPILPLDGGRIVLAGFSYFKKRSLGIKILNGIGILFGLLVIVLFFISTFFVANFSLLAVGVFILVGVFSDNKQCGYTTVFDGKRLKNASRVYGLAMHEETTLASLVEKLSPGVFNMVYIINSNGEVVATLSDGEVLKLLTGYPLTSRIKDIL